MKLTEAQRAALEHVAQWGSEMVGEHQVMLALEIHGLVASVPYFYDAVSPPAITYRITPAGRAALDNDNG
jgi:hypothetical protein